MNLSNTTCYILSAVTCYQFWFFANGQVTYNRHVEYTLHNGLFDFRYPMDTIATFTCSEGYELVGPSTRTCNSSGHWSSYTPRCHEKGDHKYQNSFMWIITKIDRQFTVVMYTYYVTTYNIMSLNLIQGFPQFNMFCLCFFGSTEMCFLFQSLKYGYHFFLWTECIKKQVCILVGCVPLAC